ncbi:calmodulin-like 5 [Chrysochromulina tobinii]|uniref:Calmodulin-like 5 n=1 Tax=Chrysochromulina tobinii TaxID=1460289 RepID=A0A0M0JBA2_9EUKA|nr:calmodulin-like 5 [Chrysochromulina tobinii]|eukprot:KOO23637.1 calmodulin-like 5 [Chrysochromulina sp. CCMP291]
MDGAQQLKREKSASKWANLREMRRSSSGMGKFITGFLASFGFSKESGLRPSMSHTEAFSVLDQDGSGTISASELKSALMKGGSSQVSEAEIQSLISQVDANGDGRVAAR